MRNLIAILFFSGALLAASEPAPQAVSLYEKADYPASLKLLTAHPSPDAATLNLIGKNYYMMGEFRKAEAFFEKAVSLDGNTAEYWLWLGRAYGRRAETGNWVLAPMNATKARECFERAVALSPHYHEALNDLFDYYLNAPGFLGGGLEKAETVARRIGEDSPAEQHYDEAQLADRRKDYATEEAELRRAVQAASHDVGRFLDLARFLARRGRTRDSDAVFVEAESVAPNDPRISYERARAYVESGRNLAQARILLKAYLASDTRPDYPSKQDAAKLLKRIPGE